jgi:maltose phosphorylase
LLKNNTICFTLGYDQLLDKEAWSKIWEMSDITIEGDVKAQQEFVLISKYLGKDSRLNGPKSLPAKSTEDLLIGILKPIVFLYMATKDQQVARNLLTYRYNQLDKAMNAQNNLGFKNSCSIQWLP